MKSKKKSLFLYFKKLDREEERKEKCSDISSDIGGVLFCCLNFY